MVRSGLVRLSRQVNHGHRTLNYLVPGQTYGFEEFRHNWKSPEPYSPAIHAPRCRVRQRNADAHSPSSRSTSSAACRRRKSLCHWPLPLHPRRPRATPRRGEIDTELLEFLVEKRFINGTASMVIDLDRCTRCDDCVRACAAAHDNNPRFLRHGPAPRPSHGRQRLHALPGPGVHDRMPDRGDPPRSRRPAWSSSTTRPASAARPVPRIAPTTPSAWSKSATTAAI